MFTTRVQNLFRMAWIPDHANVLFLGEVGLGRTRPAIALGRAACLAGHTYKHWARLFNHDSTITSAVLERVLRCAETIVVESKSHRLKDPLTEE